MSEGIFTGKTIKPMTSADEAVRVRHLKERHPYVYTKILTHTAWGRPIHALQIGCGDTKLMLTAGHHANEYITSMLCWQMVERYCHALDHGGEFGGFSASALYHNAMLYVVPTVNPDGIDLVTGAISSNSAAYHAAEHIARQYPELPFPQGWKANLAGVDLNVNYPAGWERAKKIKADAGVMIPAPRDYPGAHPLDQPETSALAAYICCVRPDILLAYHTQGKVIYHTYGDQVPPTGDRLAQAFSRLSGYAPEPVPPESANAGLKDWFIKRFFRPGFTIEAGLGENPLPLAQLDEMLKENIPLLAYAMTQ